jgi:AcrR family transcriptional regulator
MRTHFAESAILDAAIQVFSQHGIDETRVEDLIAAAKISRRTFYKYFGSKEEVLAGLYELVTGKMIDLIRAGRPEDKVGLDEIRAGIDAYLDFHALNRKLLRLLVEQAMRSDSLLHKRRIWLRGELSRLLERAMRGAGRKLDPLVFSALIAMLEGLSLHLLETGAGRAEIDRAKQIVHSVADHLLGVKRSAK